MEFIFTQTELCDAIESYLKNRMLSGGFAVCGSVKSVKQESNSAGILTVKVLVNFDLNDDK